jgi:hypothetical protein
MHQLMDNHEIDFQLCPEGIQKLVVVVEVHGGIFEIDPARPIRGLMEIDEKGEFAPINAIGIISDDEIIQRLTKTIVDDILSHYQSPIINLFSFNKVNIYQTRKK